MPPKRKFENESYNMLSFITYKSAPEQLEILADEKGLEELISYLQHLKDAKDHMHLIIDSEIDRYPLPPNRPEVLYAKQIRIEYADSKQWEVNPSL